jgi:hypothetical protein
MIILMCVQMEYRAAGWEEGGGVLEQGPGGGGQEGGGTHQIIIR